MPSSQSKSQFLYPLMLIGVVIILSLVLIKPPGGFKLPNYKVNTVEYIPAVILPPVAPKKAKLPVLVYHYVEVVTDKNDFLRARMAVLPQIFEQQVLSLKKSGYTFYFVKDITTILESQSATKPVILTFDDGYGDFYTDVFPILVRHNVKATVFINSGLIDLPNYMTREQVAEVLASGLVEIGGHGFSHQNLTGITLTSVKGLLADDVSTVQAVYKVTPVSFAYPYGAYNAAIAKLVEEAGYKYAVTLEKGWMIQDEALLAIPRIRPGLAGTMALGDYLDSLK